MKQSIGEFLATLRRANGYTQQEVADKLGISNRTLSAWERGTALPDILLLPALAELYGVTTDEILRGERTESQKPVLTQKSRDNIYKSKYARFSMRAYILTGLMCLGLLLLYIGMHVHFTAVAWVGWQWWLFLLYFGLIIFIACAVVLFALWRGHKNAADDEGGSEYLLRLRLCLGACLYALSLVSVILACVGIILFVIDEPLPLIVFAVIFAISFCCALFARRTATKRWGSQSQLSQLAKNAKFFKKFCLFSLIPIGLAVAAMILFSVWDPSTHEVIYRSADADEFVTTLQTARIDVWVEGENMVSSEYDIDFEELSKGALPDDQIHVADGITVSFTEEGYYCYLSVRDSAYGHSVYHIDKLTADDGSLSAYNLRFDERLSGFNLGGMGSYASYSRPGIRHSGEGYEFIVTTYHALREPVCLIGGCAIGLTLLSILIAFIISQLKIKKPPHREFSQ